ncbi:MAG: hypothetical protein RR330_07130 [Alistipes sp.]
MKIDVMQAVRLVMMTLAVAGVIYALEYIPSSRLMWFWVVLLGVGFVGLLYTFQSIRRKKRTTKSTHENSQGRTRKA